MEYIINNRLSKPKEPSLWYMKQNRNPEHVTYEEQVKAASKKRNNNIYRKKINGKKITVKPNGY